jgi:gamma-glutamyltranspeptidase/glutathione hydrolase
MKKIIFVALSAFFISMQAPLESVNLLQEKQLNRAHDSRLKAGRDDLQNRSGTFITTGPAHIAQVGKDILDRGGSAVDAVLASSFAGITQNMGRIVSFAGIFMMVYYEASTGKTYSLNACFKTPLEEYDPGTIPSQGIPNARGVLVPGFMAGAQAAHDRFGRLPFQELFVPAIQIAENGFPVTQAILDLIRGHWEVLGVLPETRNIFLKRRYGLFRGYQVGDLFVQPELAHTLRQVAAQGAEYMYTGEWGRHFVDIVRREGGNMTFRDMEEYEPVWADPARTSFNGYDIHALGYPSLGAMNIIEALNLMEIANLAGLDHCTESADALYRLIYCSRVGEFYYRAYAPEIIKKFIPGGDFSYESRANKENARLIWAKIESGEWPEIEDYIARAGYFPPDHSEAIIAVDSEGNIAAVCHTINAALWGNSGIFVDGVSIPAAGYFQQDRIYKVGPGEYLPDTTNPVLVLRDGLPVVASSCIGSDLHSSTVQNLYNMLVFNMSPSESRATAKFQSIDWHSLNQKIRRNKFSQSLIDAVRAMGLGISLVDNDGSEYWIGLRLRK